MNKLKKFSVAVVGAGISGLSTCLHLKKLGIKDVILISKGPQVSRDSAAIVSGGQQDNFTRVSHAHGLEFAKDFWQFGDDSFEHLKNFCQEKQIPFVQSSRFRLITKEDEKIEADIAVELLKKCGFPSEMINTKQLPFYASDRVLCVQKDGKKGAQIGVTELLDQLKNEVSDLTILEQHVNEISEIDDGSIHLSLQNHQEVYAEMLVLTCHQGIGKLLPELSEALVPIAEQWGLFSGCKFKQEDVGTAISAYHGYEWGVIKSPQTIEYGGARFLRPMAGIGEVSPAINQKIETYLTNMVRETFGFKNAKLLQTKVGVDIRPCDELPVIGPMFGQQRILVSAGYMGQGITLGFYAGYCLANLIANGKAPQLPRRFWPERLRSLDES